MLAALLAASRCWLKRSLAALLAKKSEGIIDGGSGRSASALVVVLVGSLWLLVSSAPAEQASLAFSAVKEGYSTFATGQLTGKMRLDGKSQGIASIVHDATGTELAKTPGLLSYYRVFSTDTRYGHAARDWPPSVTVRDDGALEVHFPPAEDHPLDLTGVFRWVSPDTLDLETVVQPQAAMPNFEVFLSSYVILGFDAQVYLSPARFAAAKTPSFVRADWCELVDGNYLVFPRDRQALQMMNDRRWEIPPSPVTWSFTRYMAEPIAIRRNPASGITVALMAPRDDCFAVLTPYNREPPDRVAGHSSLYLSLFGRDVAAGEVVRAHCRLIVAKDLSDELVLQRYAEYIKTRVSK